MPSLTYFWTGSTLGNQEQFNWTNLQNWKTLKLPTGGSGGTLAGLQTATRLPMGGDVVYFGWNGYDARNANNPGAFPIWSPLLYGGITTSGGTVGLTSAWSGTTLGSTVTEKYGSISCTIHSSYPFSLLGGQVNDAVMQELNSHVAQLTGLSAFAWTRVQGSTGATGGPQFVDEWTSARNWLGVTTSPVFGVSAAAQPSTTIRWRGPVKDGSKQPTYVEFAGITTPGLSGTNATANDGRNNIYTILVNPNNRPGGNPSFGPGTNVGASPGGYFYVFDGWRPITSLTSTPSTPNDTYEHGITELTGLWNRVTSDSFAVRGLNLNLRSATVNQVLLQPTLNGFVGASNFADYIVNAINAQNGSRFDLENLMIDRNCSIRGMQIGNMDGGTSGLITIHGDISETDGFPCVGATTGLSGGFAPGQFTYFAPNKYPDTHRLIVGYPQSEGTKATTEIQYLYLYPGISGSSTLKIEGNFDTSGMYMFGGTAEFAQELPPTAAMTITAYMFNDSALNFAPPYSYRGQNNTTVFVNSDAVKMIPGSRQTVSFASTDQ